MRAIISLLVTSLIVGSSAIEFPNTAAAGSAMLNVMASKSMLGAKSKKPEQPTPHRGSGRRNAIIEYLVSTENAVSKPLSII
jgi:hypothetical protein